MWESVHTPDLATVDVDDSVGYMVRCITNKCRASSCRGIMESGWPLKLLNIVDCIRFQHGFSNSSGRLFSVTLVGVKQ